MNRTCKEKCSFETFAANSIVGQFLHWLLISLAHINNSVVPNFVFFFSLSLSFLIYVVAIVHLGVSIAMIYDGDTPAAPSNAGREREREITNCELSDRDTRELDLQNPTMFDTSSFDYYERSNGRSGSDTECLDGESH